MNEWYLNNLGNKFRMILLISFSLNPKSKSYLVLCETKKYLDSRGIKSSTIDLRKYNLPIYDGTCNALENPQTKEVMEKFNNANKIVIFTPVYNYDVNANFKNFIDLLSVYRHKNISNQEQVLGVVGAMGSQRSFTSLFPSLSHFQFSLGFYLIPKIVMCVPKDFAVRNKISCDLSNRVKELCNNILQISFN